MLEKIEFLYEKRKYFDYRASIGYEVYMPYYVRFWYRWARARVAKGDMFWESQLAHNSMILIERAYKKLTRRQYGKAEVQPDGK